MLTPDFVACFEDLPGARTALSALLGLGLRRAKPLREKIPATTGFIQTTKVARQGDDEMPPRKVRRRDPESRPCAALL